VRRIGPYVALAALACIVAVTAHELATGPTADGSPDAAPDAVATAGPGEGGDGKRDATGTAGAPGPGSPAADEADRRGGDPAPAPRPAGDRPETAPAGESGPEVRLDRRRYAVAGTTARELRRSLRENGRRLDGEVAFAWTDWSVDVGYEFRRSGDSCRVTRPDVEVDVTVTLPEWRDRGAVSPDLAGRWRRDLGVMEEHEAGHVRLARRAGRRVHEALDGLRPAPCAVLRDRADAAADSVLREVKRAQEAYDERTDHGRDQRGAVAPGRR
jgi:predicted secreted Zn-dependent protease